MPKNTPTESKCGCDCIFCEENNHCFRIMCNPLVARKEGAMSDEIRKKVERGAEDFANRFEGVMKDLAGRPEPDEERNIRSILNQKHVDFEWRVAELVSLIFLEKKNARTQFKKENCERCYADGYADGAKVYENIRHVFSEETKAKLQSALGIEIKREKEGISSTAVAVLRELLKLLK